MDSMQQLALASGIAVAGGLLGAAVAAIRQHRAQDRDMQQLAQGVASGRVTARAFLPGSSPPIAMLAQHIETLQDERDRHEMQRRLQSADMVRLMNQADGAIRARDRFLAAISHDLRQPLQSMELALDRLQRHAPHDQARDVVQLQDGVRIVTGIVDELSLLSRLDAGTPRARSEECPLQHVFEHVLAAHAEIARAAGVTVHAHSGGLAVFSDPGMLTDLLTRLLDNAIRANSRGGRVLLAARRHGTRIRIEVRDGGIGIASIHQPRVFDEFFQVGNPERDHRKGFGLGLAIVSRLAAVLGTRVELRSQLHAGSCFWLSLPQASVLQRPPRAVLLDADDSHREALAAMLQAWGYAVDADSSLDAACARIENGRATIDAVLCATANEDDPACKLLRIAAHRQPQALRILLCSTPHPALLELAARHDAKLLSRPPPPSKLRSLLLQRAPPALRGAA